MSERSVGKERSYVLRGTADVVPSQPIPWETFCFFRFAKQGRIQASGTTLGPSGCRGYPCFSTNDVGPSGDSDPLHALPSGSRATSSGTRVVKETNLVPRGAAGAFFPYQTMWNLQRTAILCARAPLRWILSNDDENRWWERVTFGTSGNRVRVFFLKTDVESVGHGGPSDAFPF